jgi:hypothetical protein
MHGTVLVVKKNMHENTSQKKQKVERELHFFFPTIFFPRIFCWKQFHNFLMIHNLSLRLQDVICGKFFPRGKVLVVGSINPQNQMRKRCRKTVLFSLSSAIKENKNKFSFFTSNHLKVS